MVTAVTTVVAQPEEVQAGSDQLCHSLAVVLAEVVTALAVVVPQVPHEEAGVVVVVAAVVVGEDPHCGAPPGMATAAETRAATAATPAVTFIVIVL